MNVTSCSCYLRCILSSFLSFYSSIIFFSGVVGLATCYTLLETVYETVKGYCPLWAAVAVGLTDFEGLENSWLLTKEFS